MHSFHNTEANSIPKNNSFKILTEPHISLLTQLQVGIIRPWHIEGWRTTLKQRNTQEGKWSDFLCGANHQPPVQRLPTTHHRKKRGKKLSADSIMKVTCLMALQASGRFSLQIDKSTDISGAAQLLANVRYVDADSIKETFFFCKEMESVESGS